MSGIPERRRPAIFVDVDDTLVRHAGSKPVAIPRVIAQVRRLRARGFPLYCWSTGGAEYARRIVTEIGVADCFEAFLPKPTLLIDDQLVAAWLLRTFHPMEVEDAEIDAYLP